MDENVFIQEIRKQRQKEIDDFFKYSKEVKAVCPKCGRKENYTKEKFKDSHPDSCNSCYTRVMFLIKGKK